MKKPRRLLSAPEACRRSTVADYFIYHFRTEILTSQTATVATFAEAAHYSFDARHDALLSEFSFCSSAASLDSDFKLFAILTRKVSSRRPAYRLRRNRLFLMRLNDGRRRIERLGQICFLAVLDIAARHAEFRNMARRGQIDDAAQGKYASIRQLRGVGIRPATG